MLEKSIKKIRKIQETLPYNKLELLDDLENENLDLYVSISNRADGKSHGYFKSFMYLSVHNNALFIAIVRRNRLRTGLLDTILEIAYNEKKFLGMKDINYIVKDLYIEVYINKKIAFYITDFDKASDLKNVSAVIRKCSFLIIDEFIVLEHEYSFYEVQALKLIYESIDRKSDDRVLKIPKVFIMGNALNFSSPIISYFNLFDKLELQEINTKKIYDNIIIELRRNDTVNETKNNRLFDKGINTSLTGEFNFNNHLIKSNTKNFKFYVIKDKDLFIKVYYQDTLSILIIDVLEYVENYDFCFRLSDLKDNVTYLSDKYFDKNNFNRKKFQKGEIFFKNSNAINIFDNDDRLQDIKYIQIKNKYVTLPNTNSKNIVMKTYETRTLQWLQRFYN